MGIIHNFQKTSKHIISLTLNHNTTCRGIYQHIIVSNPKIKAPRKLQDDIIKVNISLDVAMMTSS